MANKKSSKKRICQTIKKTEINTRARSTVKTAVRAAREAIAAKSENLTEALAKATSSLNSAANKGLMHKNAVARRVSRLAKQAQAIASK